MLISYWALCFHNLFTNYARENVDYVVCTYHQQGNKLPVQSIEFLFLFSGELLL
jgi:hypothetical protein